MKKHILFFSSFVLLIFLSTGCTSKKVDPAEAEAELAGDVSEEIGDETTAGGDEVAQDGEISEDDFGGDEIAAGEEAPAEGGTDTAGDATGLEALDSSTEQPEELTIADDSTASPDPGVAATDTGSSDGGSADNLYADSSTTTDDSVGLSEEVTPKPVIPLQKMISTPYKKAGVIVNALYIAREGDTLDSVSQKIYGQDKTEELKSINSTFARRDMKVGDKVYYNSPQRPTDDSTVKYYYEELGLIPEYYSAQPGENIRTIAKNLLGNENSWKEIWSTNLDIESKGELTEGARLRYWSADVTPPAAPPVAVAPPTEVAPTTIPDAPPPMPEEPIAAAPPPPSEPIADLPPPPSEPIADLPPPPPVDAPPPVASGSISDSGIDVGMGEDQDQMFALLAGGILLVAAIAMFIIIRKKRARRSNIDFQTATHTNIE